MSVKSTNEFWKRRISQESEANNSEKMPLSSTKAGTSLPRVSKHKDSVAEILLMKHFDELGIAYMREWRFHPVRLWRFDFTFGGGRRIAVEIEGGIWTRGRHNRPKGFEADIRKYNEAAKLGWTVIRFTPNMIERGESKAFLAELFGRQP